MLTKIFEQINNVQIKSITDPLFKYSVIFFLLGIIAAIFRCDLWIIILPFTVGGIILTIGLIFYIFFSIKNPDYLRSENFHIQKKSIEILGDKNNLYNPNVKEIKYVASPYNKHSLSDNNFGNS